LVKITLITGRKNQIRVSFKHIGNYILGDSKYGKKEKIMYLFANELSFIHPITKKIVNINSVINEQLKCPFCKKLFSSITTIQEFNIHIKHCGLTSTQISKAVELFPPSQDYVLNNKILKIVKNMSLY